MNKLILLLIMTGCSHSVNTVSSITSVAKYNQILAYKEYLNEEIVVRGIVVDIGVDNDVANSVIKTLANKETSLFVFKEDDRHELQPYVVVGDKVDSKDVAICFFDYNQADSATVFTNGALTSISGVVKRLVEMDERMVIILDGCEVEH